jgi:putative ABC transport system permease protein
MIPRVATEFAADAHRGVRQMRRRPGFTATVVLTLGLGIGATVALLSVVKDLLLRPLPYPQEDRVRVFWMDYDWRGEEYDFVRQRRGLFESVAAFSTNGAPYHASTRAEGNAVLLPLVVATSSLFDVLGTRPYLGRTLRPDDDRPAAPQVVVINYGMWKQDLGGDPNVIGHQILIDGKSVTVVGVMPKSFYFPTPDFRAWRPVQLDPATSLYRNVGYLTLVGRARAGVAPALVQRDVERLARSLGERFTYTADFDKTKNAATTPVRTYMLGNVRAPLLLLLVAVALLLLIACANAAALILARTTDRTSELAIRVALGAGRERLARQMLAESFVLALASAALGTAIAIGGFSALVARLPLQGGFNDTVTMGWLTFAAAFSLALVVAIVVSLAPIRNLLRGRLDAIGGLSRERSEMGLRRSTRRVHGALVGGQVTLAVLLVAGATLLIRSVERLRSLDLGFDPRNVSTFTLVASETEPGETRKQFFRDLIARVSTLPGVTAAGLTNRLPVRDGGFQGPVQPEGRPDLEGPNRPNSLFRAVTPGFFRAMGMRLLEGRGIDSTDGPSSLPATVISESFARRMWPGRSAIGKHISTGFSGKMIPRTIVGVVTETRMTSMTGDVPFTMWVPLEQHNDPEGEVLVVRSTGDAANLTTAIRRLAAQLDPQVAIARIETMDQVIATALAQPLRLRFFLGLFGALALALGGIGVYGVVSYAVARRRAEYAIRVALGASPGRVRGEVIRHGITPVALGAGAGVVAALGSARLLSGFLFGVEPTDPTSIATAAGLLLFAGIAAALVPAWRVGRTNPASALRGE